MSFSKTMKMEMMENARRTRAKVEIETYCSKMQEKYLRWVINEDIPIKFCIKLVRAKVMEREQCHGNSAHSSLITFNSSNNNSHNGKFINGNLFNRCDWNGFEWDLLSALWRDVCIDVSVCYVIVRYKNKKLRFFRWIVAVENSL